MSDLLRKNAEITFDDFLSYMPEDYHDKCIKYLPQKEIKKIQLRDLRKDFIEGMKDYLDYVDSFSNLSPRDVANQYDYSLEYKQIAAKTMVALHEFVEKDSTAKSDQYYGRIKGLNSSAKKMAKHAAENPGKTIYLPDKAAVSCIIDYVDYTDTNNSKLNDAQNIRNKLEKELNYKRANRSSSEIPAEEKKEIRKLEEKLILANDNLNILYHNDLCNRLIEKDSSFLENLGAKVIPFRTRHYVKDTGYVSDQFTIYFPEAGPGCFCEVQLKSSLRALIASKGLQALTSISPETLDSIATKKEGAGHGQYKEESYPKELIEQLITIEKELKEYSKNGTVLKDYNSLIQKRTAITQQLMAEVATYQYIPEGTNTVKEFSPFFNFLYHYENYLYELLRDEEGKPVINNDGNRVLKHQKELTDFDNLEYFKDHMENRTILDFTSKISEKDSELQK